jgi:peptidoglycan/xylan/chitin deacetylase (PgdA/CDA1 family)
VIIALDYDGTYTADPAMWDAYIKIAKARGHEVLIATMRFESEPVNVKGVRVIYTGRKAKAPFLRDLGIEPAIWIDDNPCFIYAGAE